MLFPMEASRACAIMAEYVVGRSDGVGSIEVNAQACKSVSHVSFFGLGQRSILPNRLYCGAGKSQ